MNKNNTRLRACTDEEIIESLFTPGGTLANDCIEIKSHRINAKEVYFIYRGKEFCLNKYNVILKFSIIKGKKWLTYGALEFNDSEYEEVLKSLKEKLGR